MPTTTGDKMEKFSKPSVPPYVRWQDKVIEASDATQTGAILRCALNRNCADRLPKFEGKAAITSDGFVMCNFVGEDGEHHMGAFVGSANDLMANIAKLSAHCKLTPQEDLALNTAVEAWVSTDYREQRQPYNKRRAVDEYLRRERAAIEENCRPKSPDANAKRTTPASRAAFEASLKSGMSANDRALAELEEASYSQVEQFNADLAKLNAPYRFRIAKITPVELDEIYGGPGGFANTIEAV